MPSVNRVSTVTGAVRCSGASCGRPWTDCNRPQSARLNRAGRPRRPGGGELLGPADAKRRPFIMIPRLWPARSALCRSRLSGAQVGTAPLRFYKWATTLVHGPKGLIRRDGGRDELIIPRLLAVCRLL